MTPASISNSITIQNLPPLPDGAAVALKPWVDAGCPGELVDALIRLALRDQEILTGKVEGYTSIKRRMDAAFEQAKEDWLLVDVVFGTGDQKIRRLAELAEALRPALDDVLAPSADKDRVRASASERVYAWILNRGIPTLKEFDKAKEELRLSGGTDARRGEGTRHSEPCLNAVIAVLVDWAKSGPNEVPRAHQRIRRGGQPSGTAAAAHLLKAAGLMSLKGEEPHKVPAGHITERLVASRYGDWKNKRPKLLTMMRRIWPECPAAF